MFGNYLSLLSSRFESGEVVAHLFYWSWHVGAICFTVLDTELVDLVVFLHCCYSVLGGRRIGLIGGHNCK